MQNLLNDLKNLLQKDERLVSEGELLKNKIIELALKIDKDLIKLLLSDEKMKEVFFVEVNGTLIFDKDKFIKFVSNKQFLPDSYTAFKNKIGLIDEKGEFISEKKEVVISWPYKDCVLEGGMTKEDQKRDEIFWNEILAPDEISRLLDPKVFTNTKRIDAKGEHKFDGFRTDENGDIKDNLIIKGNNLLVLHSLKKRFAGKVKLIYIDPPYNTGNDSFKYNDSFNHSTWLTFMKNRLEVVRDLLKDDGVIFVSCDDNEQAYLKVLMDEIFKFNFLGCITVIIKPEGRNYGSLAKTHDFLLVYSKKEDVELYELDVNSSKNFEYKDDIGGFNLKDLRNANTFFNIQNRPNLYFPIYVNPFSKDKNDLYKVSLEKENGFIEIYPKKSKGIQCVWRWSKEKIKKEIESVVAKKLKDGSFSIYQKTRRDTVMPKTFWNETKFYTIQGNQHLEKLFGKKIFNNPKPEHLMKRIIEITTKEGDIILDFFAGSGTTATTSLKMKRQFIICEQMDYVNLVTIERVKKVINNQDDGGISKEVGWKGGGDFVYLELMKWNENFVEKIQQAKTKEELKNLWETMKEKAFLSYKVDIKTIDANAKEFEDLSIEDQKRFLLECLDKNHLYVNYSEIDDEEYGVSEEDKKLNRRFYGNK